MHLKYQQTATKVPELMLRKYQGLLGKFDIFYTWSLKTSRVFLFFKHLDYWKTYLLLYPPYEVRTGDTMV